MSIKIETQYKGANYGFNQVHADALPINQPIILQSHDKDRLVIRLNTYSSWNPALGRDETVFSGDEAPVCMMEADSGNVFYFNKSDTVYYTYKDVDVYVTFFSER